MPPKQYYCNCLVHCTRNPAQPKAVSRATYYSHLDYREAGVAAAQGRTTPIAANLPPIPGSSGASRPRSRDGLAERPAKTPRIHISNTDADTTVQYAAPAEDSGTSYGFGNQFGGGNLDFDIGQGGHGEEAEISAPEDEEDTNDQPDPGSIQSEQNRPLSLPVEDGLPPELGAGGIPQEDEFIEVTATLEDLKVSQDFIARLQNATLEADGLHPDVLERLRNPLTFPLDLDESPALRTSIELFLDTTTASEDVYERVRQTFERHMDRTHGADDDREPLLSHYQVKKSIAEITGVHSLKHDMCPDTCIAYTGPFSELEACPKCHKPRYDPIILASSNGRKKVPQQQFYTMPLGPQLQALWRDPETAKAMCYRKQETDKILQQLEQNGNRIDQWDDIYHGSAYLDAVRSGNIGSNDTVLLMSIDGAQLYENKQSDCWIYIWVVLNLAPDVRYKKRHVLPGGFIPGPKKPKNVDSFLFPGFHHVAALMKQGYRVWNAYENVIFVDRPFGHLGTADGPGMTYLNGLTGHSGAYGCRIYCPVKGRRKTGGNHYYPALLKPVEYNVEGCDHDDVNGRHLQSSNRQEYLDALNKVLSSRTQGQHQENRRQTGITKPSIFSGFPPNRTIGVPACFAGDLMHLVALNLTDLLVNLWRGKLDCDPEDDKSTWDWVCLTGDVWIEHGQRVADTMPYLPGSFDRPPRNPADKINSGYKAWEYLTWIYGLGPALLHGILPDKYWKNYCKLVRGIRLIHQRSVRIEELHEAHQLLVEFVEEFEELYYQRKESRIHFCRQSVHALLHIVPEIIRLGPGVYYTQWTMERTIGNLGEEIKQHSKVYANISERGLRRCQVNALKAMMPELERERGLPRVSDDLGNNYILLGDHEKHPHTLPESEANALRFYFSRIDDGNTDPEWCPQIRKWARMRLPNGQIVRGGWKEKKKALEKVRMGRNVQYYKDGARNQPKFAEVYYFFQAQLNEEKQTFAVVSVYGHPDARLLRESSRAMLICEYCGDDALEVIPAKWITSCVAMPPKSNPPDNYRYVSEKMGLDVASMGVVEEEDNDIYV
ncbi:hypothetical protein BDN70DRAFT_846549 [Pholiota conissans]|uniref:Transposase family Tnp2 protein n=1 Tax=Pholiota conissans TaxID=109636 RepID=A0A9P5ZES5_9AGAR|nr:hypothetical protein BDN70DRAFT_846549 [Pholiota conissans]